jgi:hypothetical protein
VLRRPEALAALRGALEGVDRLVVLGDALELRHGPPGEALAVARRVFAALGEALGPEGELVLVPGNHDHALVAAWLDARATAGDLTLGLEQRIAPEEASPLAAALAEAARPARLGLAYPGLWLRDDVYAIHGHQLDVHVTVPTFERLATGAMGRVVGELPDPATPADYEAVLAPVYAWLHVVARHSRKAFGAERQNTSQQAWRVLTATGPRPLRARAIAAAFPAAIALLSRVGLGSLHADVSPQELRRAGLRAMHETLRRLEVRAPHVLFGHTHRAGPLPGDDRAEWGRLVNTGSWVHEELFLGDRGRVGPYFPGRAVRVEESGPPVLLDPLL